MVDEGWELGAAGWWVLGGFGAAGGGGLASGAAVDWMMGGIILAAVLRLPGYPRLRAWRPRCECPLLWFSRLSISLVYSYQERTQGSVMTSDPSKMASSLLELVRPMKWKCKVKGQC